MKKFIKSILILCVLSSLAYAEEVSTTMSSEDQKDAMDILERMRARIEKEEEEKAKLEAEYQALVQKEMERKEEFKQEKVTLEKEVQELKERQLGREELYAKLKEDAKIRWHRDEYKKLLKRFDEYYNKLEQKIADKEQQIVELTKLLEVLN